MGNWGLIFDLSTGQYIAYLTALFAAYFTGYKFGLVFRLMSGIGNSVS